MPLNSWILVRQLHLTDWRLTLSIWFLIKKESTNDMYMNSMYSILQYCLSKFHRLSCSTRFDRWLGRINNHNDDLNFVCIWHHRFYCGIRVIYFFSSYCVCTWFATWHYSMYKMCSIRSERLDPFSADNVVCYWSGKLKTRNQSNESIARWPKNSNENMIKTTINSI